MAFVGRAPPAAFGRAPKGNGGQSPPYGLPAEWGGNPTSTSLLFSCGGDFAQGNFLQVPQRLE